VRRLVWGLGIAIWWATWPGMWLILNNTQRTRLILQDGQGRVLVLRGWLTANGKWSLPGGGVHRGEELVAGLLREVREETGLVLKPVTLLKLGKVTVRSKGIVSHLHYFVTSITDSPTLALRRFEIVDAAWLDLEKLTKATTNPDTLEAMRLLAHRG